MAKQIYSTKNNYGDPAVCLNCIRKGCPGVCDLVKKKKKTKNEIKTEAKECEEKQAAH